jgi:sulfatase maturation enzyme AslB (radical SAM superfamily)
MSAIYAWPAELEWRHAGVALTLVVPATACNLSCGFCAIRQRRETLDMALSPVDYAYFVNDIARAEPTAIVSIQGYEPLLPESWAYTDAILSAARARGVPSSLVTNGILLEERALDLAALQLAGVTISIDSASEERHDRLRGRIGALTKTLAGMRKLAEQEQYAGRITVSSVLLPRRRHFLDDIPNLLAENGVRHWAISPLLKIGHGEIGGPVAPTNMIIDDVLFLHEKAASAGVEVVLDDELGRLRSGTESYGKFLIRRFDRPEGLVRLVPSGACSIGHEILREVDQSTPLWRPSEMAPATFLASLRSGSGSQPLMAAA